MKTPLWTLGTPWWNSSAKIIHCCLFKIPGGGQWRFAGQVQRALPEPSRGCKVHEKLVARAISGPHGSVASECEVEFGEWANNLLRLQGGSGRHLRLRQRWKQWTTGTGQRMKSGTGYIHIHAQTDKPQTCTHTSPKRKKNN